MYIYIYILTSSIICLVALKGARGFPGTPGLPGIKGHRVSEFMRSTLLSQWKIGHQHVCSIKENSKVYTISLLCLSRDIQVLMAQRERLELLDLRLAFIAPLWLLLSVCLCI